MIAALGFWAFLLSATAIFIVAGETIERLFILLILACTVGTMFAGGQNGGAELVWVTFAIDLVLWLSGLFLVIATDRFWPIWFTGFHTNTILLHFVSLFTSDHYAQLLNYAAAAWAIPALGVAAYGVLLDYRSGQRSTYN